MIMIKLFFVIGILLLINVDGLKIGICVPDVSGSQILFNQRIAETLSDAGHNVTLLRFRYMEYFDVKAKTREDIHEWTVDGYVPGYDLRKMIKLQTQLGFADEGFLGLFTKEKNEILWNTSFALTKGCEKIINNKEFVEKLKNSEFDVIFAHMMDFCPIGLIHVVKPKSWAWVTSGPVMDHMAYFMGLSLPASYAAPVLMDSGDRMTFFERAKSVVGHTITPIFINNLFIEPETEIFRKTFGRDFPHLADVSKSAPLLLANSNELYDLPRPTLTKILYIGGIGMKPQKAKPLSEDVQKKIDEKDSVIVFSFGSVANASLMSMEWKRAFMEAFGEFPRTQFFMRYPIDDMDDFKPKNVELLKWLPQVDLLNHPKTKAFITHGGFNSLQEAINSATPLVTIPLFGDQFKNAQIIKKHNLGIILPKNGLNKDSVVEVIRKILEDQSYSEAISRMKKMIQMDPFPAEEKLVKWTRFLGEFQTLDNLRPVGADLDFVTFYNIDVYFVFGTTVIGMLILSYLVIRMVFRKAVRFYKSKVKKD